MPGVEHLRQHPKLPRHTQRESEYPPVLDSGFGRSNTTLSHRSSTETEGSPSPALTDRTVDSQVRDSTIEPPTSTILPSQELAEPTQLLITTTEGDDLTSSQQAPKTIEGASSSVIHSSDTSEPETIVPQAESADTSSGESTTTTVPTDDFTVKVPNVLPTIVLNDQPEPEEPTVPERLGVIPRQRSYTSRGVIKSLRPRPVQRYLRDQIVHYATELEKLEEDKAKHEKVRDRYEGQLKEYKDQLQLVEAQKSQALVEKECQIANQRAEIAELQSAQMAQVARLEQQVAEMQTQLSYETTGRDLIIDKERAALQSVFEYTIDQKNQELERNEQRARELRNEDRAKSRDEIADLREQVFSLEQKLTEATDAVKVVADRTARKRRHIAQQRADVLYELSAGTAFPSGGVQSEVPTIEEPEDPEADLKLSTSTRLIAAPKTKQLIKPPAPVKLLTASQDQTTEQSTSTHSTSESGEDSPQSPTTSTASSAVTSRGETEPVLSNKEAETGKGTDSEKSKVTPEKKVNRLRKYSGIVLQIRSIKTKMNQPIIELRLRSTDVTIPENVDDAFNSKLGPYWKLAVGNELDSLQEMKVYKVANDYRGKTLSTRWVFAVKINPDGYVDKLKARLVVRGFEADEWVQTFAPTLNQEHLRLLLAYATIENMHIHQIDIKTAFLYSPLKEKTYITISGVKKMKFKLLKTLYGLKQGPRNWYLHFKQFLLDLNFTEHFLDQNVYTKDDEHNQIIIAVYVDDILIMCKSKKKIKRVKDKIRTKYTITDLGSVRKFLGLDVQRDVINGKTTLSAARYIQDVITKFNLEGLRMYYTPLPTTCVFEIEDTLLTAKEKHLYQQLVGTIRYLTSSVRPDIAYAARRVSHYLAEPNRYHLEMVYHIMGYLKRTMHRELVFDRSKDFYEAYADASFAPLDEKGRSVTGTLILFAGAPVFWTSTRQSIFTTSTRDAELLALASTILTVRWENFLLEKLGWTPKGAIKVHEDNIPLIETVEGDKSYASHGGNNPWVSRKLWSIQTAVEEFDIELTKVSTKDQLADLWTKSLPRLQFEEICERAGMPCNKMM